MSSTFFGLHVAYSGVNAANASINTTANNVSNVQTKGYSRQTVNLVASSALRCYQKFGSTGTGVSVDSVTQLRDQYYDTKFWNNQSDLRRYEKRYYYMKQIENYYTDGTLSVNSSSGFSTIYGKMFNALETLKSRAGDTAARNEFISDAQELCTYFNSTAQRMQELQSSVNDEIKTTVQEINAVAQKVALLNQQINTIEMEGGHANELRDQRALLVDGLSKILPVSISEEKITNSNFEDQYTGATYYTLKINGQLLVDNYEYNTLAVQAREEKYNQSDIEGLYDIVWEKTEAAFDVTASTMSGELKAMFEVRDGNNSGNLSGRVIHTTSDSVTIGNGSITDIDFMNMPEAGTIWINNTKYNYTSFSFETDEQGSITSYTFDLEKPISTTDEEKLRNKTLNVGESISFMGIPYYMNQMNIFLRSFCRTFNEIQQEGVDLNGDEMNSFFVADHAFNGTEYTMTEDVKDRVAGTDGGALTAASNTYYQLTATNVTIADASLADPTVFATQYKSEYEQGVDTHDLVDALQKLQSKTELFRGGGGDTFLQCIYADITVDTQESQIFTDNYTNIGNQIDKQRTSVSGVDEDEEALDLMKFRNAYNLSCKCISVLAEMYDQLILNTGV